MAGPADLDKQIGDVRDSMESSIVVLRDRGKRELRRVEKVALVAAGVGAAVGLVVLGIVIIRRLNRPPTARERLERVVPLGWWDRLQSYWLGRIPPVRLYVGDRQVGEEHAQAPWEQSAMRVARVLGASVGTAAVTRLATFVAQRIRERAA